MNDRFAGDPQTTAAKPAAGSPDRAFVLHTYPYLETSLIVEAFTARHGRVVLVAKGAKRARGVLRGMLSPFQLLLLNWFGKSEMKTLKSAEQERIIPQLSGPALLSAFYMNELMLKLTHREDAHETLFDAYGDAIVALAGLSGGESCLRDIAAILRQFEVRLLQALGYALQLREEADTHHPLDPAGTYLYHTERGPICCSHGWQSACEPGHEDALQLAGKTLIDMGNDDYGDQRTRSEAKLLTRRMINHLLGDKILHTRTLIRDLK